MPTTPDTPRPTPPLQQTPDRGPVDPHHEPAKGDGEPGEAEAPAPSSREDEQQETLEQIQKKPAEK